MAEPKVADADLSDEERMQQMLKVYAVDDPDKAARAQTLAEIRELGLERHLGELDAHGYTIVRGAIEPEQAVRARDAIVRVMERNQGRPVDIENETDEAWAGINLATYLLFEDEVFESILMAPRPLALINYLLGRSCVLSSMTSHFKGPGAFPLMLHSDNGNGMTAPFASVAQVANVNYALTPYSEEAGALAMVPGSNRLARNPRPDEIMLGGETGNPNAIPVDLQPGDCAVWHGSTWHGSFIRQVPGIRINLAQYFCRQYIVTQERYAGHVPQEVLDRHSNDARFLTLLGQRQAYGWGSEGPDTDKFVEMPRGQFD
ncbi:MAG: hypothetical protein F4X99_03180 [Gammaproteobacteria bacterium]|nr:hypothetical protein [Gammaproteobacteria bacterium]